MSVSSILSGFLPHETKVSENTFLSSKVKTVPEILQRYGYKTAAVVSNYVLRKGEGFEQGFTLYDDTMKKREVGLGVVERIAEDTTSRAVEVVEQFGKGPMFVWLHYQDPHGPYTPPGRFAEMFRSSNLPARNLRRTGSLTGRGGIPSYQMLGGNTDYNYYVSQYDGEIGYLDEQFGRLVDALKKLGLYDNSLIIFTSDHGEGMGEHDYFFAHGEYLYNDQLHVPLIIKHPGVPSGAKSDFVQHADLLPTILDTIGVDADKKLRGRSLLKEAGADKEIFAGMRTRYVRDSIKFSLIYGQMKMIYTPIDLRYELFDLKSDFYEQKDLVTDPQYRVQAENIRNRLERIMREDLLRVPIEPRLRELNQQEKDALKSLGYVR
jgi:arylsulfatase A-like enzyme